MEPQDPNHPLPTTPVAAPPAWTPPPPPPYVPPPAPPRRDRLALWVVGLIFGGLFLVFLAFLALAYTAVKGETPSISTGPRIGIIEVKGGIGMGGRGSVDSDDVLKIVKRYRDDSDMKAVVVRVDSPGGAVAPSQEMFDAIRRLAKKKKVVCSMGNLAASGGFYVSMACSKIVAEPGTLTGSIGVISQFPNLTGIADWAHFKMETIKSGKLKDAGNPFRDMTPDDRAYWQSLIDSVYQQFLGAVAESRHLKVEDVKPIADGRVLTGQQALQLKLIDQLGNFDDAVELAKKEAGLTGEPRLVYPPDERAKFIEDIFGDAAGAFGHAIGAELKGELGVHGQAGQPGLFFLAQ